MEVRGEEPNDKGEARRMKNWLGEKFG